MKKTLSLLLFLSGAALAAADLKLVASPARAAAVERRQFDINGRDYWYLLKETWYTLDDLKDEPFVRDAGILGAKWGVKWENNFPPRTLFLRDIRVRESSAPVKFSAEIVPAESDTKIYNPRNLTDADPTSVCAVSGGIGSSKNRYLPVEAKITLSFPRGVSVSEAVLSFGAGRNKDIGSVRFVCAGKELKPASLKKDNGILTAAFRNAPRSEKFVIFCQSAVPKIILQDFAPALRERLLKYPFTSHLMRPVPYGLTPENFDREAASLLLEKYDRTHKGICFAEWDSQAFFQSLNENNRLFTETVTQFGPRPGDRAGFADYMKRFWDWHNTMFFDTMWGMSGAFGTVPYGMEWGGKMAGMELTNHTSTIPHRTLLRYTAGAARQHGRPWLLYLAYYLGKFSPDSTRVMPPKTTKNWASGPDAGISPSFARRVFLAGYFMGANYQSFEAQPWGQAEKSGGRVVLNANGKVLKDFYGFVSSPAGKRGTWYTPILLAVDYLNGMTRDGDVWTWSGVKVPQTKGDLMGRHFNRAIDPWDGQREAWNKPPYSHNMHNSPLGDIFDTAIANPPSGRYPRFEDYAAVVLPDGIAIDAMLRMKLESYVSSGGTLVINSIHQKDLPPQMMSAKILPGTVEDSGLVIPKVRLVRARPAMRTDRGTVFAVQQKYGLGNVVMTLPEYFLGEDKEQPNAYLVRLLEQLQKEVLPFRIEGDCQFIVSRLAADHWKLAVINNKGVLKEPWERQEKFDDKYTSSITVRLPEGARVASVYRPKELAREGADVRFTLPPGEVTVLEIKNVKMSEKSGLPLLARWPLDGSKGKAFTGRMREAQYDMKYAALPSGRKVYDASNPGTAVIVSYTPGFELNKGSFEFWAAPDFSAKLSDRGGYPLAARFFRIQFYRQRWNFTLYDAVTMPGPPAEDGRWDHIVFTWDGSESRFFVNAKEYTDNGVPLKTYLPVWNGNFDIATLHRGRRTFGGKISEVKLYAKALTPEEIRDLYEKSAPLYGK
ncbi:MAG: LamG domain-containing protein [Lentisphaeria bacterium]|nr:LamG domain-containing protein [Lentisphaeria bacterium]